MQQQQSANYDLLAVFPNETQAAEATDKLHKAGFTQEEVHQLPSGIAGSGQFREHGPNRSREDFFLQKKQTGPRPATVLLFALAFALILGLLTFVATFALPAFHVGYIFLIGAVIGLVVGLLVGLFQRGRVRGDIGQKNTPPPPTPRQLQGALNVVALRFEDPENISRKSRARAILINHQGKIDRSVGRLE